MSDLKRTAAHGIKGDRLLGHLTPGDAIVPAEAMAHPPTAAAVHSIYAAHGLPPGRFIAGHPGNSRNPTTGLRQFDAEGDGEGDGGREHEGTIGSGQDAPGTSAGSQGAGGLATGGGRASTAPGDTPMGFGGGPSFGDPQGPGRERSISLGDVLTA